MMTRKPLTPEERLKLCRQLGISGLDHVHRMVVEGKSRGAHWLLNLGLGARHLELFGYTAEGMERLGYDRRTLAQLGYAVQSAAPAPATVGGRSPAAGFSPAAPHDAPAGRGPEQLRRLIAAGLRASELHSQGYTIHDCKRLGLSAMELAQLNFPIEALATVCTAAELRRANFGARDLRTFFSGSELKQAGFRADEMRMAGFSVRDLLNLGYNENHIRTAGYSTNELLREGLTTTTRKLY